MPERDIFLLITFDIDTLYQIRFGLKIFSRLINIVRVDTLITSLFAMIQSAKLSSNNNCSVVKFWNNCLIISI